MRKRVPGTQQTKKKHPPFQKCRNAGGATRGNDPKNPEAKPLLKRSSRRIPHNTTPGNFKGPGETEGKGGTESKKTEKAQSGSNYKKSQGENTRRGSKHQRQPTLDMKNTKKQRGSKLLKEMFGRGLSRREPEGKRPAPVRKNVHDGTRCKKGGVRCRQIPRKAISRRNASGEGGRVESGGTGG